MKHIFTVHSHITYLSALAVIKYKQFPNEDIIIITNKYNPALKKYQSYPSYDQLENSVWKKLKHLNYPAAYDKYIFDLTKGEEFTAYIDLMSAPNRILITNKNCIGFHFLEEGIVNYGNYDSLRLFTIDNDFFPWRMSYRKHWKLIINGLIRIIRGRSVKILSLPIHPTAYTFFGGVNFYCFSDQAYPNVPSYKKQIIPFHTIKTEMLQLNGGLDISSNALWLGDMINKVYNVSLKDYSNALSLFLKKWSSIEHCKKKVFIKYKKGQSEEEKEITTNKFLSLGFEIEILPDETIIEALLIASKNVSVLGNGTSLLLYGHVLGHNSYSMFRNLPNKYDIPLAKDYPNFWKMVKEL